MFRYELSEIVTDAGGWAAGDIALRPVCHFPPAPRQNNWPLPWWERYHSSTTLHSRHRAYPTQTTLSFTQYNNVRSLPVQYRITDAVQDLSQQIKYCQSVGQSLGSLRTAPYSERGNIVIIRRTRMLLTTCNKVSGKVYGKCVRKQRRVWN